VSSQSTEIHYRLNERDEIVFVNGTWDEFASANSGESLTAPQVLGRLLWGFITDRTTRALYRDVLARARGGFPVRFAIRCDSPACRRLLEMEIACGPENLVEFRVRTLSEEKRPSQLLFDPNQPRSEELVLVCGWCKKVHVGDRWAEVEEAVSLLGLFERKLLPDVTHGICEDCYARVAATLGRGEGIAEPTAAVDRGRKAGPGH
jgi:hypothetical protein